MNPGQTMILGDLSGLQDFLFDVSAEGGGQARRLRARSVTISLLAECAARRILDAVGWGRQDVIFSSAGKFLLVGSHLQQENIAAVKSAAREAANWLLVETCGSLRLAIATCNLPSPMSATSSLDTLHQHLHRQKLQPWANCVADSGLWKTDKMVLPSLSPPCELCRRRPAGKTFNDDSVNRKICHRCYGDLQLGRDLPSTRWLEIFAEPNQETLDLLGFGLRTNAQESFTEESVEVFPTTSQCKINGPKVVSRPLLRNVPKDKHGQPIEFKELAAHSFGMPLLGVLKMDADNMGTAFRHVLEKSQDLHSLGEFSKRVDKFLSTTVNNMLALPKWNILYVIFSGGDDLFLVGPWDKAFDFAAEVRRRFNEEFSKDGLTISAGMAMIKPTIPIRDASEQADLLLDRAKTETAPGGKNSKDQFCVFGQVWKWHDHEIIARNAGRLVSWVQERIMPRGWLHTFLELAEAREKVDAGPVTARLAYHIGRNFPPRNAFGPRGELRNWAESLLDDFDEARHPETRFLPTILRYALTATRSPKG
jgi:CRISPR-associated protein Cas10/Csm1 subtype III-A